MNRVIESPAGPVTIHLTNTKLIEVVGTRSATGVWRDIQRGRAIKIVVPQFDIETGLPTDPTTENAVIPERKVEMVTEKTQTRRS